ncbi:MAG: OmpW family outer membrane protein [Caulobacteraceae bacterium]
MSTPKGVIPGATISANDSWTAVVEAGYYLTPSIAVSFTGGAPPTAKVDGAGSIAGQGRLGSVLYGPMSLTAHYHYNGFGRLRPYIGGGAGFHARVQRDRRPPDRPERQGPLRLHRPDRRATMRSPAAGAPSSTSRRPTCARRRPASKARSRSPPR